jgi:hypothetical protein
VASAAAILLGHILADFTAFPAGAPLWQRLDSGTQHSRLDSGTRHSSPLVISLIFVTSITTDTSRFLASG